MITEKWTGEMDATLIQMVGEGRTYRTCADEITTMFARGITRSAAIGRGHRLGLRSAIKPRKPETEKRVRVTKPRPRGRRPPGFREPPTFCVSPPLDPTRRPVAFLALKNGHCRWPVDHPDEQGAFYCGGPADLAGSRPYCTQHTQESRRRYG
jgi:GcrA cell cycle regulator